MSKNRVIGKGNELPWHLPSDLKRFKELTTGHTIIMGRKCWESIPAKFRPLPNRKNIVVTTNERYVAEGAKIETDLVSLLKDFITDGKDDNEVFVIGGAEIYKFAFDYADKLYLTEIQEEVEGDVFLEGFQERLWIPVPNESQYGLSENGFNFNYLTYVW